MNDQAIRRILAAYQIDATHAEIHTLGSAGGFSGTQFWKVHSNLLSICVRKWPNENLKKSRLLKIHSVLKHAFERNIKCLPVPLVHETGSTIYQHQNHLWEVAPWLPGIADFWQTKQQSLEAECLEKLRSAATVLAEFHLATADAIPTPISTSPSMPTRLKRLQSLANGGLDRIRDSINRNSNDLLKQFKTDALAETILTGFCKRAAQVEKVLQDACCLQVPQQVCIKDIWHDHLLFTGSEVTGIVDFGAMKIDSIAADIARLFGSLVEDDQALWQVAMDSYQQVRPLSADELQLVKVFDQSGVLMSGLSWLEWLFVQGREFEDLPAIKQRLTILARHITAGF